MNKQELLETISTLNDKVSPQLRTMVYIDWSGCLILMLIFIALTLTAWTKKDKINKACHDSIGSIIAWGMTAFTAMILTCFIPYTIKVFNIPELVALETIFRNG